MPEDDGDRAYTDAWIALEALRVDLDSNFDPPVGDHAVRVEQVGDDYYIVCSCGWVSSPYTAKKDASGDLQFWCHVGIAERERLTNRAKLRARLADL